MYRLVVIAVFALMMLSFSSPVSAGEIYDMGTVWSISMIKTEVNMQDEYIKDLAGAWNKIMAKAVEKGLVVSYKVMIGEFANPDDWDILLMIEIENMAAFDTDLEDEWDKMIEEIIGTEDQQIEQNIKKGKIREHFGSKLMREISIK